ncbi:unnamed protein product [Clavelina lepadiformis]|uniref:Uncharacterized protein n=1 Tax=Clavelina lepadiformis TaxID=159417 RepID=A0ABP0EZ31_CLALP
MEYISPEKLKHYVDHMQQGVIKRKAETLLYANSKLMNILFTIQLAKRLEGNGVIANCACPGIVKTPLFTSSKRPIATVINWLLLVVAKSPEQGCQCILHCAISREAGDVNGKFFRNCEISEDIHPMSNDEEVLDKLWKISEELTGLNKNNTSLSSST